MGAIFMVLFGLMIAGLFTPKFLMGEKKLQFKNRPSGYFGSSLIGLAFAAGWTPCSGPIIGVIMGLAATNPGSGVLYMLMYVLGFAIPFFVLSFFVTTSWLDSEAQWPDYESRGISHDCIRNFVVFRRNDIFNKLAKPNIWRFPGFLS